MPVTSFEPIPEDEQDIKTPNQPKVVVMGAAGVGKTSVVHQFLYDRFPDSHVATVEEMHKTIYDIAGIKLSLELLDTTGSYEFPAMKELSIKTKDAFVLVYAINDKQSFDIASKMRDDILKIRSEINKKTPIVFCGNKVDLEDQREVCKKLSDSLVCIDWEHGLVECSAKHNYNVVEVFQSVFAQARVCIPQLATALDRRSSMPVYGTGQQVKHSLAQKRQSCNVQ